MKRAAPWILPALLAACAATKSPRPLSLEDAPLRPAAASNPIDDEERQAQEALQDIEERVRRGDLPQIQFAFDSADITPRSFATLDQIAQLLLSNGRLKLRILAHTDSIGAETYNLDLSQRRAKSVKAYLASRGVPPPSMRFQGYGFSRPVADNSTDEGRALNRRVEFKITTRDWNAVY